MGHEELDYTERYLRLRYFKLAKPWSEPAKEAMQHTLCVLICGLELDQDLKLATCQTLSAEHISFESGVRNG